MTSCGFKYKFIHYQVDDIKKYTIFDVLGEIEDENLLNSKLELILYGKCYELKNWFVFVTE